MESESTHSTRLQAAGTGVDVINVGLAYRESVLFKDLSLHFPAREWTCLLGPSGVGKSTLLRLIAGLEDHQEGTIRCSDENELNGRIAYMAQQDLLLPWLSLTENALFGSRLRGQRRPDDVQRARTLLDRVGLGADGDKLPAACSGGMRQRAAVVRTLMEDRPIVLMDEPFSSLDVITRLQLQAVAADLLNAHTVILVTHDPLEALRLGHRIYVMSGSPARVGEAIVPQESPPREPGDPEIMRRHADLLERLSGAT